MLEYGRPLIQYGWYPYKNDKCMGTSSFPGDSMVKNLPANAGDMSLIPELGRSPEGGSGTPLQYSCLGNPMDKGDWWATVYGVTKESDPT